MSQVSSLYQKIPKDLRENLRWRKWILQRADQNKRVRDGLIAACQSDPLFYVNGFVWQFNPRKKDGFEVAPFLTWDFQERAILKVPGVPWPGEDPDLVDEAGILWCIDHDEDLLIEKSREMGASWLSLLIMDWKARSVPWQKFLCISRNEKAVDAEDPDSLFWKVDFVHRHLPDWLRGEIQHAKLYFGYANGSTITGQASTGKAGVGGRASAMFIDEFSQIGEDYEVLHRTSDTTGCRIFNGTHMGLDTAFYELSQRVDMKKLSFHWTQHPEKRKGLYRGDQGKIVVLDKDFVFPPDFRFVMDGSPVGGPFPGLRSPWYDEQCRRKGSARAVAMDLDINPTGSVSQFFDPLVIRALVATYACPPFWEGSLRFDKQTGRPEELVSERGGKIRLWCHPDVKGLPPVAKYAAGADIATGSKATPSCLAIANANTGEKILQYTDNEIEPQQFAALCVALCWLFRDENGEPCLFAWETQGPGAVFGRKVMELGYRNVYYRVNEQKFSPKITADTPGWMPLPENKRVLLEQYRDALRAHRFTNRCKEALEETLAFRYTSTGMVEHSKQHAQDPTGAGVNHGDHVIADALCYKMVKQLGATITAEEKETVQVGTLAWRRQLHERQQRSRLAWH